MQKRLFIETKRKRKSWQHPSPVWALRTQLPSSKPKPQPNKPRPTPSKHKQTPKQPKPKQPRPKRSKHKSSAPSLANMQLLRPSNNNNNPHLTLSHKLEHTHHLKETK